MDILESSFEYFRDIFTENAGPKALIMDDETIKVIGLSITRTEILSYEVLMTETLSDLQQKPQNSMIRSLKCIVVIRPNHYSVELLCNELSEPHFSKYSLYFTNSAPEDLIKKLASFDRMQLIDRVEEIFVDYYPLHSRLFHSNIKSCAEYRINRIMEQQDIDRMSDSLFSALCSLQIRPCVRYDSSSQICANLSHSITKKIPSLSLN